MILYEKPLRIELEGNTLLVDGEQHLRAVRKAKDLEKTLMDARIGEDFDVYYMFRKIYFSDDIRFDITVIPSGRLGSEAPKTFGHHHPDSGNGLSYPEVYQVLQGKALFILQKNIPGARVEVIMVDGEKGDVMVIPSNYGHVTVNKGGETLVLSNLIYDKFDSLYDEYAGNQGAAYYYLKDGEVRQNSNYIVEKNERITAKEFNERHGFQCKDLLVEFYENPQKFTFLKKPELLFE